MMDAVDYRVELAERHAHLYAVEAVFPVPPDSGGALELQLPVWTPGSYLVREYGRHLQDVVCDDAEGRELAVRKTAKASWRVEVGAARRLRVRYRVYAYELSVRTAHLDDTHAFWNGACLFLYVGALRQLPARVTVAAPEGWRVTVGLEAVQPNVFLASSYDELVDSPFEVGTHELLEFSVHGRPHRIAIWGRAETPRDLLVADVRKIIDAAQAIFQDSLPYPDYTFIVLVASGSQGGLEHARSATLLASPFTFAPRKKYEDFLELVAHEYFHLWNVKRIHPAALGPFDYQREAYTRSLWLVEGVTSYYDRHLLVRAGLLSPERYLERLGEELGKIALTPGRFKQSLEESSFDAWIKFYRPDENSVNSSISYYLKGGLVALLLDLEIRARSGGRRSLDDVMRLLWRRHGRSESGFADEALPALMEEAASLSLAEFFERHVRGRGDIESERLLRTVGLELLPAQTAEDAASAWLGVHTRQDHQALVIAAALDGGPAQAAGLYAGDEVVAIDGFRSNGQSFNERIAARRPGERLDVTVFRRDELRTVAVTLVERPPEKLKVQRARTATAAEKAAFRAWLGSPLAGD